MQERDQRPVFEPLLHAPPLDLQTLKSDAPDSLSTRIGEGEHSAQALSVSTPVRRRRVTGVGVSAVCHTPLSSPPSSMTHKANIRRCAEAAAGLAFPTVPPTEAACRSFQSTVSPAPSPAHSHTSRHSIWAA